MRYEFSSDLQGRAVKISMVLFPHVKVDRIKCFRSYGTGSKRTIARCHALGKLMQKALEVEPFYCLEFLSERFDKLSFKEQTKVIIHELMHIPFSFGGGFKHHDVVTNENVNRAYELFIRLSEEEIN